MLEAVRLLDVYGYKTVPQGKQNSQDWVLGASGALERANLAPTGTAGYWQDQTGKGLIGISKQLIEDGRPWVRQLIMEPARESPVDTKFGNAEKSRSTGRRNLENYAHLMGGAIKK
ncbi:hypothetical protein AtubIFM55763_005811 [Aspergillus tubingensis]|nr:hypothetical protein AtubIFM55763_005811 [Aspergillus tubingensis]